MNEGRPSRRPSRLRAPAIALALAVAVAPLFVHFAAQRGIASIGDDSVAYLVLARFFAGEAGPHIAPWVAYSTSFPPLFPLALAAVGGGTNLLAAHLLVAAFSVAAVVAFQRYARLRLGSEAAALLVTLVFLLAPSAWVSAKGILSEPMYLLVSLVALHVHARFLEPRREVPAAAWLGFGVLLAAALLTRAAGIALVAAFVAHASWRAVRGPAPRTWRPILALLPVALFAFAWIVVRPTPGADSYHETAGALIHAWLADPGLLLRLAPRFFFGGWVSSFTADPDAPLAFAAVFGVLGLAGLGGAVRAARAHRLDGCYVIATAALVFLWVFREENARRLLYPILPLLLLHATELALAAARRFASAARAPWIAGCALAPAALLCVPALVLVQQKSFDRAPRDAAGRHAYADITEYYSTLNVQRARAVAGMHLATLAGFDAIARHTPPDARVMWMRPEYVAVLGGRAAAAFDYGWSERRVAEEIRRTGTGYLVLSRLYKTDLAGRTGDPAVTLAGVRGYADPVYAIPNPAVGGDEFVLLKVDPERLERFLGRAAAAQRP